MLHILVNLNIPLQSHNFGCLFFINLHEFFTLFGLVIQLNSQLVILMHGQSRGRLQLLLINGQKGRFRQLNLLQHVFPKLFCLLNLQPFRIVLLLQEFSLLIFELLL